MKNDILVVGGYGEVGKNVVSELIKHYPEQVIVAGRNLKQAISFVRTTGHSLRTLELDIYDNSSFDDKLDTVRVVIMCLSPKHSGFAEYCVQKEINYIDISPSNQVASEIEQLKEKAVENNITCILGVGLAPGLSTLLAKTICAELDAKKQINLSLMLGLGEKHGTDGVKWLLDNLACDFKCEQNKRVTIVKPFVDGLRAEFPLPMGTRKAYAFNLADQQILSKTLSLGSVSCYFCYNSRFITFLVHILKKAGVFNLLKYRKVYNIILNIFNFALKITKHIFSDAYAVHVYVVGTKDNQPIICSGSITGNNNSLLTGKVAAYVGRKLYEGMNKPGVYYLNEMFDLDTIATQYSKNFDVKTQYHPAVNV